MNPTKGSLKKAHKSTFVVCARTMKPLTEDVLAERNILAYSAKLAMTIVEAHGLYAQQRTPTKCA